MALDLIRGYCLTTLHILNVFVQIETLHRGLVLPISVCGLTIRLTVHLRSRLSGYGDEFFARAHLGLGLNDFLYRLAILNNPVWSDWRLLLDAWLLAGYGNLGILVIFIMLEHGGGVDVGICISAGVGTYAAVELVNPDSLECAASISSVLDADNVLYFLPVNLE
jgi:hypothetical protein